MLHVYLKVAATNATLLGSRSLGDLYDETHEYLGSYAAFILRHSQAYTFIAQPGGSYCEDLHTPPNADAGIAEYYNDPNCVAFCAVRDPLHRFLSAWKQDRGGSSRTTAAASCTPEFFELDAASLLESLRADVSQNMCMYVPQVYFVYGAPSKAEATTQYCQHILHQENLSAELNALMEELGKNFTLSDNVSMSSWTDWCPLEVSNLTQEFKDLFYHFYRADYEAFGYSAP
jgi:hypothetical protein